MFGRRASKRLLLDPGTTAWIFDGYAWALAQFGTDVFYESTTLVLPSADFFPVARSNDPEDIAREIFESAKTYAGLAEWPCELVAQDPNPDAVVAPTVVMQGAPVGPAGTISASESVVTITYDPGQVSRPQSLVATFAHELAHFLGFTAREAPPGGHDFEEYVTDLLSVFLGFGIFAANSAFEFNQYTGVESQGWSVSSQGYLSQYELTYCLAIFLELKGLPDADAMSYLDRPLRKFLKKAQKELGGPQAEEIERLKAIHAPNQAASGEQE